MASRRDEHQSDKDLEAKHIKVKKSTDGGACLTAHESSRQPRNGRLKQVSCNYRWQAFKQASSESERDTYNNRDFSQLSTASGTVEMRLRHGWASVPAPTRGQWNINASSDNFQTSCNVPYWHEAHHIIPHGELRDSINAVGEGPLKETYRLLIRNGLLNEKYNLNRTVNMIILPLDDGIARVLGLPRHRHTPEHFSHRAYSKHVRELLTEIFDPIKEQAQKHIEQPDYVASKAGIERKAASLRERIKQSGGNRSLDETFADETAPSLD